MQKAESLYYNGKIYSSTKENTWSEAIAVAQGRVLFVGSLARAKAYVCENTEMVDLDGAFLFPGFIDAHAHPIMAAYFLSGCIFNVSMSRQEIITEFEDYMREHPEKDAYFGHGYAEWMFEDETPHKSTLDDICPVSYTHLTLPTT